jgi:hypothetical protein
LEFVHVHGLERNKVHESRLTLVVNGQDSFSSGVEFDGIAPKAAPCISLVTGEVPHPQKAVSGNGCQATALGVERQPFHGSDSATIALSLLPKYGCPILTFVHTDSPGFITDGNQRASTNYRNGPTDGGSWPKHQSRRCFSGSLYGDKTGVICSDNGTARRIKGRGRDR